MIMQSKKQFTLIELIVVIAIVIVLAASAIMILSSFIVKARDTRRSADLRSMQTALETAIVTNAKYPYPDGQIKITASGTVIMYQGQFGFIVSKTVNMSKEPKDPGDDTYYTYSVNAAQKKYAIMALMENAVVYSDNNKANAVNYSTRIPNLAGDKIGILLNSSNTPLQEISGLTGVDVVNTTGTYSAYLTNSNKITGTGSNLIALKNTSATSNNYDSSLIAYWDMETLTKNNLLADLAGNGNNGTRNNVVITGGKVGKAMYFNGSAYINIPNSSNLNFTNNLTISLWIKTNVNNAYRKIITKSSPSSYTYGLSLGPSPYLLNYFHSSNGAGAGMKGVSINRLLPTTEYVYIVLSVSNNTMKLYWNGELINSENFTGSIFQNSQPLRISGYTDGSELFNGYLDEIRLYNRALTDEEIKAFYEASK